MLFSHEFSDTSSFHFQNILQDHRDECLGLWVRFNSQSSTLVNVSRYIKMPRQPNTVHVGTFSVQCLNAKNMCEQEAYCRNCTTSLQELQVYPDLVHSPTKQLSI